MRITFALPGLDGLSGGLRVVSQYARHLQAQGHDVTLVVRNPGPVPGLRDRLRRIVGIYPPRRSLPAGRGHFTGLDDLPVVHLDTHRPIRAKQVPDGDVVVSTWWTTAEWADRLPRSKGRHIHFIQDYEDFHPSLGGRVKAVYDQANVKIVVASWLQRLIAERHGRQAEVVMNGVDTARFDTPARPPNDPPRIGFLYNGHPRKNVALAIEAAGILRSGSGVRALSFGTMARPAALPEGIDYDRRPSQDRIAELYASCDLWLFPSRSEGFGLPLLEAMASRTPVIATGAGAAPDLIDGRNGMIVAEHPHAMAKAVRAMMETGAADWRAASDAALATARANDLPLAASRFETALIRAAQGGPAR